MARKRRSGKASGRRKSRRRSAFSSRRFSAVPRGLRKAKRRFGRAKSSGAFAFSLKRPVPIAVATLAGGVGLVGLTWAWGKAVEKWPSLNKPYVGQLALGGAALAGGYAIAKYGRMKFAGAAVAFGGLAMAGLGLINTLRAQIGTSGVGLGRTSGEGAAALPQYQYQIAGEMPENVRRLAALNGAAA